MYQLLKQRNGSRNRLEQEKIPQSYVDAVLGAVISFA
jgi:hypothetical protein